MTRSGGDRRNTFTVQWRVVFLLSRGGAYTAKQIADRLGERKHCVDRVLNLLSDCGWPVRLRGDPRHKQRFVWSMEDGFVLPEPRRVGP